MKQEKRQSRKPGDIGGRGRHPNDPTGEIYGDHHWPLPQPHERARDMKYVILDTSTLEGTSAIAVGHLEQVQLMGKLLKASGRTSIIAPPLENRSFSALSKEQLQYLLWNTCQQTPPENYGELILACFKAIDLIPVDPTPNYILQEQVNKLQPDETEDAKPLLKRPALKKVKTTTSAAPKEGSVTGRVRAIAEQVLVSKGWSGSPVNFNWVEIRGEVMRLCETEGINKATAGTQYSKFKASKLSQTQS